MDNRHEIISYLRERKDDLLSEYQLIKIGLFGSFARDENSEDSDIDILVEFQPNTKDLSGKKESLKKLIREKFNRRVDICREKYIKPYFKTQILESVIYV